MAIHIGKVIHALVGQRGLKAKAVADFLSISDSTLFKIYNKSSVDVDKLIRFSQLLNTNLFLYYTDEEPLKGMFGRQVTSLQSRIRELENELAFRDGKINSLEEMVEMQKKIIVLHEERSQKSKK